MKKASCLIGARLPAKNGRGNQHKFEPSDTGVGPFLSVFLTFSETVSGYIAASYSTFGMMQFG